MRTTYILALALVQCSAAAAQNGNGSDGFRRHEISAGFNMVVDGRNTSFLNEYKSSHNLGEVNSGGFFDFCLPLNLQYMYNINKRLAVGCAVGFSRSSTETFDIGFDASGGRISNGFNSFKSRVFYAMPVARCSWAVIKRVSFYSKAGLGYYHRRMTVDSETYGCERRTSSMLSYQVTYLGIKASGRRLGLYAEAGYGDQGFLQFGLSYGL